MAGRRLDPEERARWQRVTAGVRPLRAVAPAEKAVPVSAEPAAARSAAPPVRPAPLPIAKARPAAPPPPRPGTTLDGSWDRRLARGTVAPDLAIDLHGHTLASAHAELDAGLAFALAGEARLLLLVTGRPPRGDAKGRGAIRGEVMHWLAGSRHAARIAAVRPAHPRHGGAGALYVILRRARSG